MIHGGGQALPRTPSGIGYEWGTFLREALLGGESISMSYRLGVGCIITPISHAKQDRDLQWMIARHLMP